MEFNESTAPNFEFPLLIALEEHDRMLHTDPEIIHGIEGDITGDVLAFFDVVDIELVGLVDLYEVVVNIPVEGFVGSAKRLLLVVGNVLSVNKV